jgi:hypothetical protein
MSLQETLRNADSIHPVTKAVAVTPSDSTIIPRTRGLWIGVGGAVSVEFMDQSTAEFSTVGSGTLLPVQVRRVLVATAASSILALY